MSGVQAVLHSTTLHNLMLPPTAGRTLTEPRLNRLNSESRLPPAARLLKRCKHVFCRRGVVQKFGPVPAGGCLERGRRQTVTWSNLISLIFEQCKRTSTGVPVPNLHLQQLPTRGERDRGMSSQAWRYGGANDRRMEMEEDGTPDLVNHPEAFFEVWEQLRVSSVS
jgi:hypothetical protein